MAKQRTGKKAGGQTEHKAYWQQPWVTRVMQGEYSSFEKLLFMRVVSFGPGGCWMENKTLMAELGRSESTVRTAITKLWLGKEIWVTNWNNHKRRIYAARNPEVLAMAEAWYRKERKDGKVTDKTDFHLKIKSRLHQTPQKAAGYPLESCGVGGEKLRGDPAENQGVHISKSRERIEELELRQADLSLPADGQSNPPAKVELDIAIRAEFRKRLPRVKPEDFEEHSRRAAVLVEVSPKVREGIEAGLSLVEAVDRVFNEHAELINGGEKK